MSCLSFLQSTDPVKSTQYIILVTDIQFLSPVRINKYSLVSYSLAIGKAYVRKKAVGGNYSRAMWTPSMFVDWGIRFSEYKIVCFIKTP
jgi:hypothetical protein